MEIMILIKQFRVARMEQKLQQNQPAKLRAAFASDYPNVGNVPWSKYPTGRLFLAADRRGQNSHLSYQWAKKRYTQCDKQ